MKMHPPLQFRFMLPESRATSHIFIRPRGLQVGGIFGVGNVSGVVRGGVVVRDVVGGVCGVVVGVIRGVVKISHLRFRVIV